MQVSLFFEHMFKKEMRQGYFEYHFPNMKVVVSLHDDEGLGDLGDLLECREVISTNSSPIDDQPCIKNANNLSIFVMTGSWNGEGVSEGPASEGLGQEDQEGKEEVKLCVALEIIVVRNLMSHGFGVL